MSNKRNFARQKQFFIKNWVNFVIIGISFCLSVAFFAISLVITGIWHELLINLSASMLAIGITVILVDILRERKLESQYRVPRSFAVKKILGAHSVFSINLAIKNRSNDASILPEMMQFVKQSKNDQYVLGNGAREAFLKLETIPFESIVAEYSDTELTTTFTELVQNIRKNYTDTSDKYMFSFSDAPMRADYAHLLENLDAIITAIEIINVSGKELEEFLKPTDEQEKYKPMTINSFIGSLVIGYIKSLNQFLNKYTD
jgi:hypothetical protein